MRADLSMEEMGNCAGGANGAARVRVDVHCSKCGKTMHKNLAPGEHTIRCSCGKKFVIFVHADGSYDVKEI